jgi:hypothetical protein
MTFCGGLRYAYLALYFQTTYFKGMFFSRLALNVEISKYLTRQEN